MTILELIAEYGLQVTYAQAGDTLKTISRRVYGEDTDITDYVMTQCNKLYSWDSLDPGTPIYHIHKSSLSEITIL